METVGEEESPDTVESGGDHDNEEVPEGPGDEEEAPAKETEQPTQ